VHAEALAPEALPAPTAEQWVARYDYKFLRDEERGPPRHLLLGKRPDVPLLLAKPPEKAKGAGGRTELLIELAGTEPPPLRGYLASTLENRWRSSSTERSYRPTPSAA